MIYIHYVFVFSFCCVVAIYRLLDEPIDLFFTEFSQLLELTVTEKCIIAGDINIHGDKEDDRHTQQLNNLLKAFNLAQIINAPTHNKGHTLDVVIFRQNYSYPFKVYSYSTYRTFLSEARGTSVFTFLSV